MIDLGVVRELMAVKAMGLDENTWGIRVNAEGKRCEY